MLRVVEKPSKENQELRETLDAVLQRGALKMLQEVLEAEVEDYITRHRTARDGRGRAQVVRNGQASARQLVTGSERLGEAQRWRTGMDVRLDRQAPAKQTLPPELLQEESQRGECFGAGTVPPSSPIAPFGNQARFPEHGEMLGDRGSADQKSLCDAPGQ